MSQTDQLQNASSIVISEMPQLERVYSLIKAMYEQKELKEFASKWLEELQKSVFAWKISDDLLIKRLDFESCYFAAQTLKTKIQHSFRELPPESYDSLKNSVINNLMSIDDKVIQTQLCLSVTYIFFLNQNWTNPIEELSSKLPKNKFFEILICIAQEYDENRPAIKLSKQRRQEIYEYLSQRFPTVMQLLMAYLQESLTLNQLFQEQIALSFFICFESWFIFAKKDHLKDIEPVLNTNFVYLKNLDCNSDVHEKATDSLCKVIYQCEAHSTFADLRVYVMNQVFCLEESFQQAIAHEDSEKLSNFARIFTELGNSTIEYIIYDQVDTKILQLILNCVAHYEFEVAEITFSFWYNFSESAFKHISAKFVPWFNLLLSSLSRHCQLESDSEGIVDEKSDQYDFRLQISDLIREVIPCCDWASYIESANVIQTLKTTNWETVEVNLYIIYCIVSDKSYVFKNEKNETLIPQILNFILSLSTQTPPPHLQIFATSCEVLGELNEWIDKHPSYLEHVLNFLIFIISSSYKTVPKLSSKASGALKQIIKLSVSSPIDLNFITSLFGNLVSIYSQIEDISVDLSVSLMACCTAIVSNQSVSKHDNQEMMVQQLIELCLNKINAIMSAKTSNDIQMKQWEKVIDNIYAVFKNFVPNEKTLKSISIHNLIRDHIWPFLKLSITHFSSIDSQVIEHCSRCVRHIVRSMKPSYLLQPIVDHIVPLYQQYSMNSPLLYIGSVLVDEFGDKNDPILSNGLILMLNAFSNSTFLFLNEGNLSMHPYTIDDFFNLCARIMNKITDQFLSNTETLNNILNLAMLSIYLDQKEANDSITRFITHFVKIEHPVVDRYIKDNFGQKLLFSMIDSIMFKLPSYFIPEVVEPIWTFKISYPELFNQYLQQTCQELSNKAQSGGYSVSNEHLKNFYESVSSATNPKRLVSELRALQRLFN